jgi:hypothetical protein
MPQEETVDPASEMIQIQNPDFGGDPATVSRHAYNTLYAQKGFKVVDGVKDTNVADDGSVTYTYNYESPKATKAAANTGGNA